MPDIDIRDCACSGGAPSLNLSRIVVVFYCGQCGGYVAAHRDHIDEQIAMLTNLRYTRRFIRVSALAAITDDGFGTAPTMQPKAPHCKPCQDTGLTLAAEVCPHCQGKDPAADAPGGTVTVTMTEHYEPPAWPGR